MMIIISVLQWNEISMSTFILYESINLISYVHDDIIVLFFSVTFWWIRNRDNGNAMKNYHTVKFKLRNQHFTSLWWYRIFDLVKIRYVHKHIIRLWYNNRFHENDISESLSIRKRTCFCKQEHTHTTVNEHSMIVHKTFLG